RARRLLSMAYTESVSNNENVVCHLRATFKAKGLQRPSSRAVDGRRNLSVHMAESCGKALWRKCEASALRYSGGCGTAEPNAVAHAIAYAMHSSRSHDAVIRVYDHIGDTTETHEHAGDLKRG